MCIELLSRYWRGNTNCTSTKEDTQYDTRDDYEQDDVNNGRDVAPEGCLSQVLGSVVVASLLVP